MSQTLERTDGEPSPAALDANATPDAPQEFVGPVPRFPRAGLTPEIRRLSTVSNWRSVLLIAAQWAVIAGSAALAIWSQHWAVYLLAAVVIAGRQQALGILVHEATHYHLFTNRTVNDVVSDLCLGFPVGIGTTLYRHTHQRHHRHTSTDDDPDWVLVQQDRDFHWPKTWREAWHVFWQSLCGLNLYKMWKPYQQWSPAFNLFQPLSPAYPLRARLLFVGSTALVLWIVWRTNFWLPGFLLFVLPGYTLVNLFTRVRLVAEHLAVPGGHELKVTRTVIPAWWERALICPLGINYHLEHHLFPSVPAYNVARLHRFLMQNDEYRSQAHIVRTYYSPTHGVLAEMLGRQVPTAA